MKDSKVGEAVRHISMVRPAGLLIDAQRTLIQRLSLGKLQALIIQDGNVGQGLCHIWVLWPQRPFSGRQLSFICPWVVLTVLYESTPAISTLLLQQHQVRKDFQMHRGGRRLRTGFR